MSLDPPMNCSAGPKEDNIYEWVSTISQSKRGQQSLWQNLAVQRAVSPHALAVCFLSSAQWVPKALPTPVASSSSTSASPRTIHSKSAATNARSRSF